MEILVPDIPFEGLAINCSRDRAWFQRQVTDDLLDHFSVESIVFDCFAHRMGQQVSIKGSLEIHCSTTCTRCLEAFSLVSREDFFYAMTPAPSRKDEAVEVELAPDELEIGFYDNDRIDLEPMIAEQALLQIPVKTICDEGCRGLCSICGENLNHHDCGHETTAKEDSPFAVLKHFKAKKG